MAKVNDIHIGADDMVVLSREKILMSYSSLKQFRETFEIPTSSFNKSLRAPGTRWGTLNKGKPISKIYIDWDATKFQVVPNGVKASFIVVDEFDKGVDMPWQN